MLQPSYVLKRGGTSRRAGFSFATKVTKTLTLSKPILDSGLLVMAPLRLFFSDGHVIQVVKKPPLATTIVDKVLSSVRSNTEVSAAAAALSWKEQHQRPTYLQQDQQLVDAAALKRWNSAGG